MSNKELIFDGKEKQIFQAEEPGRVLIHYKDDTTAYGGLKRAVFPGKGALNCQISALVFECLAKAGVRTHYLGTVGENEQLCEKVDMLPLHMVVRNYIAGSTAVLLGLEDGFKPKNVVYELKYDNEGLGDPMINSHHAVALGLLSYEDIERIYSMVKTANDALVGLFTRAGIKLVDYRIEFGRTGDGELIIADEISPDTSRMWDAATDEKLDKDRFRLDLGFICDSYRKVYDRLKNAIQGV